MIANEERDLNYCCTKAICSRLVSLGAQVLVSREVPGFEDSPVRKLEKEAIYQQAGIIVALGGDGTILHIAKKAAQAHIPVLGVNVGRLGYMAGIEAYELESLSKLIDRDYQTDRRMLLRIEITGARGKKVFHALNDAVVSKGALSRIIDIEVTCNGRRVSGYRADGVIVSTPTGSTAYALSAGGPVIDPVLESIGVIPICPHSLISRSLLFSPASKIGIVTGKANEKEVFLTVDGQETIQLSDDDQVSITRADHKAKLIRLKDNTFYEVVNQKLSERGI